MHTEAHHSKKKVDKASRLTTKRPDVLVVATAVPAKMTHHLVKKVATKVLIKNSTTTKPRKHKVLRLIKKKKKKPIISNHSSALTASTLHSTVPSLNRTKISSVVQASRRKPPKPTSNKSKIVSSLKITDSRYSNVSIINHPELYREGTGPGTTMIDSARTTVTDPSSIKKEKLSSSISMSVAASQQAAPTRISSRPRSSMLSGSTQALSLLPTTFAPMISNNSSSRQSTVKDSAEKMRNTSTEEPSIAPAILIPSASAPIDLNSTLSVKQHSFTSLKGVSLAQPGSRIIQKADSSGLIVTSLASNGSSLSPPPLTKEVIEWLSHERIDNSERSLELQNALQSRRHDMMMQRQHGAAKQMRLANRLSSLLARQMADNGLNEQKIESDFNRHDHTRSRMVDRRDLFWNRVNDIQQAIAFIRSP